MTIPAVGNASYPSPDEVRNQLLSDLRYGYAQLGVTANVEPGSELYLRADAIAKRVSIAIQNGKLAAADMSPLDATGDALDTLAGIFGVVRRGPSSAAGLVLAKGGGTVTIPAGFQCTSPSGIKHQTPVSRTLALSHTVGTPIEVQAVTGGAHTNQAAGTILTWDSAAIGLLDQTCIVEQGGIDGGSDADDDEALRQRLLDRLSLPGVGGNASYLARLAQDATAAVERAFVYPAARGPASYDVAVVAEGGDRALSSANVAIVANAVVGQMPGSADANVTTVSQQQLDVVLNVSLPLPVNAGGAGGGWRDAAPWPSTAETGASVYAQVSSVANLLTLSQITIHSTNTDPPAAGKRFAIWNPTGGDDGNGEMAEFAILSVAGASGAYVITIDTDKSDPISFITVGSFCSAGAENLKAYAATYRDAVLALGPGEKTANVDILPRGRRRPGPDVVAPTDITSRLLSAVENSYAEVANLTYALRAETGAAVGGPFTTRTSPAVPATTADPPRILTLKHLSIRRQI